MTWVFPSHPQPILHSRLEALLRHFMSYPYSYFSPLARSFGVVFTTFPIFISFSTVIIRDNSALPTPHHAMIRMHIMPCGRHSRLDESKADGPITESSISTIYTAVTPATSTDTQAHSSGVEQWTWSSRFDVRCSLRALYRSERTGGATCKPLIPKLQIIARKANTRSKESEWEVVDTCYCLA
jgi:hypothetical protein